MNAQHWTPIPTMLAEMGFKIHVTSSASRWHAEAMRDNMKFSSDGEDLMSVLKDLKRRQTKCPARRRMGMVPDDAVCGLFSSFWKLMNWMLPLRVQP